MSNEPALVSCLTASQPARWPSLQRALLDFAAQDFPRRELVVVVNDRSYADTIESFLADAGSPADAAAVKVFARPARSAQECLVYALCHARGDYVTFWDDDNVNAPERLSAQVARQARFPSSPTAFSSGLYHYHDSGELFVVDLDSPGRKNRDRCLPATLMFPRDVLPAVDQQVRRHPSADLADALAVAGTRLVVVPRPVWSPLVSIGVSHDSLRSYEAHRGVAPDGPGCRKAAEVVAAEADLRAALDRLPWDGPVDVCGSDGKAFRYEPAKAWPPGLLPIVRTDDAERVVEDVGR